MTLTQLNILQNFLAEVFHQSSLSLLGIEGIEAIGVHGTLTIVCQYRCLVGQGDVLHQIFLRFELLNLTILRIHAIEADIIAVLGGKIYLTIDFVPFSLLNAWIEILGHRSDFLIGKVHEIHLIVVLVRNQSFRKVQADAIQCLRRAGEENLRTIGRELGT